MSNIITFVNLLLPVTTISNYTSDLRLTSIEQHVSSIQLHIDFTVRAN